MMVAAILTMLAAASVSAQAQTFKIFHTFTGPTADGAFPSGELLLDAAGNLYGTTFDGGDAVCFGYYCGTVFKVTKAGEGTVLYNFTGGTDGAFPQAGLVADFAGNLYGTTPAGGNTSCLLLGCGTVFKLDRAGAETVLHTFTGGTDGASPYSGLVRSAAGDLYGTTSGGGSTSCGNSNGCGTVFRIDLTGKETVAYRFRGSSDGANPEAGLIRDAAGNFYGTTGAGGSQGAGTVFKIGSTGQEQVLYSFEGGSDGATPDSGLIRDSAGNLYGTTFFGGETPCPGGCGTVFKLDTTGKETVLYSFSGPPDGSYPSGSLVMDAAGNLYGATSEGGSSTSCGEGKQGCGTVFKLDTAGKETVLHSFTGGTDGAAPTGGLVIDAAGNLYGTASAGGNYNQGVVFGIKP
ncbi:MAG TPA: choice-of-anchor tandem repeat GloVer-containing protein [Terriglobia bacterium]|nr:choice-of-anchor tandem repeat GloVer-containing protein [Terriglobia bacterium]